MKLKDIKQMTKGKALTIAKDTAKVLYDHAKRLDSSPEAKMMKNGSEQWDEITRKIKKDDIKGASSIINKMDPIIKDKLYDITTDELGNSFHEFLGHFIKN